MIAGSEGNGQREVDALTICERGTSNAAVTAPMENTLLTAATFFAVSSPR
jgi:hypothetical protein